MEPPSWLCWLDLSAGRTSGVEFTFGELRARCVLHFLKTYNETVIYYALNVRGEAKAEMSGQHNTQ